MTVGVRGVLHVLPIVVSRIEIVVKPRYDRALLGDPGLLVQIVAHARELDGVAMQMRKAARDHYAVVVMPRPLADTVARVDGGLARARLCAQVSTPCEVFRADGRGELLAMRVRACEAAEIAAVADRLAGHEEAHRMAARHTVLCRRHRRRGSGHDQEG